MIVFNDPNHGHRIAEKAGTIFNPAVDTCIARVGEGARDGVLLGGVTYTGYTGASIGMHVAGFADAWVNRDMLWVCFHYPFVQLGANKIIGQVPAHNIKALDFDLKLGFKVEARVPDVFPEGDLLVLGMYRADCQWLKLKPSSLTAGPGVSDGRQVQRTPSS